MALKYSSADRMIYLEVLKIKIVFNKSGVLMTLIGINLVDITWCSSKYGTIWDVGVYCLGFSNNFIFALTLRLYCCWICIESSRCLYCCWICIESSRRLYCCWICIESSRRLLNKISDISIMCSPSSFLEWWRFGCNLQLGHVWLVSSKFILTMVFCYDLCD